MLESGDSTGRLDRGRIPSLDGARAMAVALVILVHGCQTKGFPGSPAFKQVLKQFNVGVEVFFIISGFLITNLMLRELDRSGRISLKGFYARRALRIFPAYISYLAVLFLMTQAGALMVPTRDWVLALTYTVNFVHHPTWQIGHIWSLSIEEHFYLLWPLVVIIGGLWIARRVAIAVIAMCFVIRWILLLRFPQLSAMSERWTFTSMGSIAFGCLMALLTWEQPWRDWLDRACHNNRLVAGAIGLELLSLQLLQISGKLSVGFCYTLDGLLLSFLLWTVIRRVDSVVGRFLNHKITASVGVASYSLYLWQQLFLNRNSGDFAYRFPQNVLFACCAAAVSHWVIERPFLKLKSRLAAPKHGAVDGESAQPVLGIPEESAPVPVIPA